uniref:Uncharacterized protein n=1 Tax=viral metagenome TaxID=1070528 RepID=A0A6M3LVX3_9ZZZZ
MKLHKWKQTHYEPGYKRETCQVCGAIREDFNMYVRYAGGYGPTKLNGERQPYCPGRSCNANTIRP